MKTPRLALTVQYAASAARLPTRAELREWTQAALRRRADVTLRIVGAREGRALNRQYRGRDYATNVLTFVYAGERPLAGDIALCAPVVTREAKEQRLPLRDHYAHLVVHGVLHLQGYDHEAAREALRMERLEARILARIGIADPYARERREARGERSKGLKPRSSLVVRPASRLPPHASPAKRASRLPPPASPAHAR